jgi:hypothetical protein
MSFPNRDRLPCRSRPLILGMSKSTTRQPVRSSSGERRNASPDENAWAANPIERIKTSIAFPTASSSSTMATIGPLFGTSRPVTARQLYGATDVVRETLPIQPRRNHHMLRLYKCIGAKDWLRAAEGFFVKEQRQRHRPHIIPICELTKKPLQPGTGWRGKEGRQGVIGLEGGVLHNNGTHWHSLLI